MPKTLRSLPFDRLRTGRARRLEIAVRGEKLRGRGAAIFWGWRAGCCSGGGRVDAARLFFWDVEVVAAAGALYFVGLEVGGDF